MDLLVRKNEKQTESGADTCLSNVVHRPLPTLKLGQHCELLTPKV
jgi:hypothetical protein